MVEVNSKAPDFRLQGNDGKVHTLQEFKGKALVLYFYPRDDTPGCTIEAKGFNKKLDEVRRKGAEIVGVSKDGFESHCKFRDKYGLRFLLLSDPDSKIIKEYDAYGNRGIFGMGTLRKTYIINSKGRVAKVFEKVNPKGHEEEILGALAELK